MATFAANLIDRLASGKHDEQPPQVVAVVELRETALGHALEEAVERVLDDVFLIRLAPARPLQDLPGQADQARVIALPERLGGGLVALLQGVDPVADGAGWRHGRARRSSARAA